MTRILATFLVLSLTLPSSPAWALRTQSGQSEKVETGLEEALLGGNPHAAEMDSSTAGLEEDLNEELLQRLGVPKSKSSAAFETLTQTLHRIAKGAETVEWEGATYRKTATGWAFRPKDESAVREGLILLGIQLPVDKEREGVVSGAAFQEAPLSLGVGVAGASAKRLRVWQKPSA